MIPVGCPNDNFELVSLIFLLNDNTLWYGGAVFICQTLVEPERYLIKVHNVSYSIYLFTMQTLDNVHM